MDEIELRRLVTHGWERQGFDPDIRQLILRYIHTGNPEYLHNTRYAKIREGLLPK